MIMNYTLPGAERSIVSGSKKHTMREDRKERWKPGKLIHHTTGARSKRYKCFLQNDCISTQLVLMAYDKIQSKTNLIITVDRRRLTQKEIMQVVFNDGFLDLADFVNWFFPPDHKTGYRKRTLWSGKLIHWTDLKY